MSGYNSYGSRGLDWIASPGRSDMRDVSAEQFHGGGIKITGANGWFVLPDSLKLDSLENTLTSHFSHT